MAHETWPGVQAPILRTSGPLRLAPFGIMSSTRGPQVAPFLYTIALAEQALGNCGYKQIRHPLLPSLAASILALGEPIHHPGILRLICVLGVIRPRVLDSRIAVKLSPSVGQQRLTIHYAVGWREDSGDSAKASRLPKASSTRNWQPWANFRTFVIDNTGGGAAAWTRGSDRLGSERH